uniref:Uncharacterized protein n=1 Tax=Sus scrofa TaxID=9823 RepID=A0A8D1HK04_PIG
MAIIKKSANNKHWRGCGEKGTLLHHWLEYKLVQPLWKTVWRFLKKLKTELPYDPAISISRKVKSYNSKRYIHPDVHSSTIYTSKTWKNPKCPSTDEWEKKM